MYIKEVKQLSKKYQNTLFDNVNNKLDCRKGVEYNLQKFQTIFAKHIIFKRQEISKSKQKFKRTRILKISGGFFCPPERFFY